MQSKFCDRFEPDSWAAIYESTVLDSTQWGFSRGSDLVREACLSLAKPGELWLDVGSGTGHLVSELASAGLKITGLDHDRKMIALARQRFGKMNFLQATAAGLPLVSGSVDGLVAVSVMGCFDSPQSFYRETHRVLRPSGLAILTCTNRSSLLLKLNAMMKPKSTDRFHLYTLSEVTQDLTRNGFEVLDFRFYNFFINPGKNTIPSFKLAKSLERFGRGWGSRYVGRNFLVTARRL